MRDKMINKYIAKNHAGTVFTDSELKVINEGNIDDMVTFFDNLQFTISKNSK